MVNFGQPDFPTFFESVLFGVVYSRCNPQTNVGKQLILSVIIVWVRNGASKPVVMGNSHFLRFLLAEKSSSAGRITKAPVLVLSSCQGTIIVYSVAQTGETIHCRRLNFCEVSSSFSQTLSLALHDVRSSSFRVQHCFFFKFSGLCSEHCSKLEHCVASVFSMYIIILRFSSFFFFSIYIFISREKCV